MRTVVKPFSYDRLYAVGESGDDLANVPPLVQNDMIDRGCIEGPKFPASPIANLKQSLPKEDVLSVSLPSGDDTSEAPEPEDDSSSKGRKGRRRNKEMNSSSQNSVD